MPKSILTSEMVGCSFGRWTVLRESRKRGPGLRVWECRCSCGTVSEVSQSTLRSGGSKSCGCLKSIHGEARNRHNSLTYCCWRGMKERCRSPKCPGYKDYGGRGIQVCQRWQESYPAFLSDMGPIPDQGYSIERVNNNGHYEPGNCRWATMKEQGRNKRNNRLVTAEEVTLCVSEWAERKGIDARTIVSRLRAGWDEARSVTEPARPRREGPRRSKRLAFAIQSAPTETAASPAQPPLPL